MNSRERTACFTGHRNMTAITMFIKKRLKKEIERLIEKGVIYFGNGGAAYTVNYALKNGLDIINIAEKYSQTL